MQTVPIPEMDTGEKTCLLYSVDCSNPEKFLSFVKDREPKTCSFETLIHLTNSIEFEAPPTLEETIRLIANNEDSAILRTHTLYSQKPASFVEAGFDPKKLCDWNRIIMPMYGKFRTFGVQTTTKDGIHIYPHHSIVPKAIDTLGYTIYKALVFINKLNDEKTKRNYCIALSAFAQFYFLDIHPFADGNGRIARYISHRIASLVSKPIPMFENREIYIESLIEGRKRNSCESLYNLFLESPNQ